MLCQSVTFQSYNKQTTYVFSSRFIVGLANQTVGLELFPIRKQMSSFEGGLYEYSTTCELVEFVVSGVLRQELSDTYWSRLILNNEVRGALVTSSLYLTDENGNITNTLVNNCFVGIVETISLSEQISADYYKLTFKLNATDTLANFSFFVGEYDTCLGIVIMCIPYFKGVVSNRYVYTLTDPGATTLLQYTNWKVYDRGADVSGNIKLSNTQEIHLLPQPAGEVRVCCTQYATLNAYMIPQWNNYAIFPTWWKTRGGLSLRCTVTTSQLVFFQLFNYTPPSTYTSVWSTSVWVTANVAFIVNIPSSLAVSSVSMMCIIRDASGNAIPKSSAQYTGIIDNAVDLLIWACAHAETRGSKLQLEHKMLIDISHDRFYGWPITVTYPIKRGETINFKQLISDIANCLQSVVIFEQFVIKLFYISYSQSLVTKNVSYIKGTLQIDYEQPFYINNSNLKLDKKTSGGASDIAASVTGTFRDYMTRECGIYNSVNQGPSSIVDYSMCQTWNVETYLASNSVGVSTGIFPPVNISNLVSYKTSTRFRFTFQTYETGLSVGTSYQFTNLPAMLFNTLYCVCVVTQSDELVWYATLQPITISGIISIRL